MCVVIIGLSYLNASELSNYIKNDTDMSVYFPKSQVSKGKVSYGIDGLRIEETFEIKLEKNENGNVTMNKTGYNLDGKLASKTIFHFDKTLRTLKNYVQIFNIEIIKKIKWDTLIAEISGDNRNFTINNYKQGAKVNASRSLVLDNNTVYMDTIKVFLLGCLNKGIRNFNADLIVDSQNIKIPVEFELVRTKNLLTLSPEYKDVPDFFVKNSKILFDDG